MNIRIGADPELFLVDAGGVYTSAIGIIGGTKSKPRQIREDGCAVQEDNVAVEFNIPPASEVDKFIESINFNLDYITNLVKERGLSLSVTASAEFPKEQLLNPKAQEFGCEPDYNCWTLRHNPRPKAANKQLRSSGGHVHVETKLPPFLVARALDIFVGVPAVRLDPDTRRRELYGKAGACRPKPYGVEYRTLSNFWLGSDELKAWVFEQTQRAHKFLVDHSPEDGFEADSGIIQECINTSNINLVQPIMEKYGV